jgi:predicted transcriptional regulator
MLLPRLSNLEMQIMEVLWENGALSAREIQERIPGKKRPAYTTIQTMVHRLESKKAIQKVRKISKAYIFEAAIPRDAARRRLIDDFFAIFGGQTQPVMTHLVEAGRLSLEDVRELEKHVLDLKRKAKKP